MFRFDFTADGEEPATQPEVPTTAPDEGTDDFAEVLLEDLVRLV